MTAGPTPAPPAELAGAQIQFHRLRARAWGSAITAAERVITHTGGLPGYVSIVTLLPERSLGVAVLTNDESGRPSPPSPGTIVDHDLGAPATDWIAAYLKLRTRVEAETAEAAGQVRGGPRRDLEALARRSRNTPAPTRTPGTATSSIEDRADAWSCASPRRRRSSATWSTGSTTPSSSAGATASSGPTPT